MLKIIPTIVMCLLGLVSACANPVMAGESLSDMYAVAPDSIEVDSSYVEARVTEYFSDIPVMIAIASCESEFRQYEPDGRLLVNPNPRSTASGVYQILYKQHAKVWAKNPQTNITTLEGNMAFARQMYEESGTSPWNSSKGCWSKRIHRYEMRVADATS
jgi:hypothetical protein